MKLLISGAAIIAAAITAATAPAQLTGPLALLPDTSEKIIPFADQLNPGYSDRLVEFVATHFAGTQKMRKQDNDRFRAENRNWILLHYRLATSSSPADYIHEDVWQNDWIEVASHEDWFLHNASGHRHHEKRSQWDLHDIDNMEFRHYWATSVIADMRATGSQGVFADSYEAGVSGYGITKPDSRFEGQAPIQPPAWKNGRTWADMMKDFTGDMMRRLAATPEKFFYMPNLGGATTGWWWPDYYSGFDSVFLEDFALHKPFVDWVLGMNRILPLARDGKFIIAQGYPRNVQERLLLVGSYLLIKGQRTYINAAGAGVFYYPEYDVALGPAKDPLPKDVSAYAWNQVFKREFRDGIVLVNPRTENVTVTMPTPMSLVVPTGGGGVTDAQLDDQARYVGGSLKYTDIQTLTVPAGSAVLLRRK